MKLLHMSDLHLGRRFYNLSFLPIQQALLQEVLQIIDEQQVTVLLLCGDIYDKPVPPADAVQLLDWFLTQLAARSVHVCMISGNHDSPERLQFGSDLLQKNQIHIAGTFSGKMETVSLSDAYGTLTISMLPYVKLAQLSVQFPEQSFANPSRPKPPQFIIVSWLCPAQWSSTGRIRFRNAAGRIAAGF